MSTERKMVKLTEFTVQNVINGYTITARGQDKDGMIVYHSLVAITADEVKVLLTNYLAL